MIKITMISATWCPSCIAFKKILNEIIVENKEIELNVLDYDLNPKEIAKYNLKDGDVLPILMINENKLVGEHKKDEIEEFIERNKDEKSN
jgi:glutaredoxin